MNWIAYNDAHDVVLPGSKGKPLPFLMYPQAEIAGTRRRQPGSRSLQLHDYRARSVIAGINYPWAIYDGRAQLRLRLRPQQMGQPHWSDRSCRRRARGFRRHGCGWVSRSRAGSCLPTAAAAFAWTADGGITGLDAEFFQDMDAAIEIASSSGVRLCLVLIDYPWFHDPQRRLALLDRDGGSAFLDQVIDPFLDRYGKAHGDSLVRLDQRARSGDPGAGDQPQSRGVAARSVANIRRADVGADPATGSPALITLGGGRWPASR